MELREPSANYLAALSQDAASALDDWTVESLGDISSIERGKFSARPRNDPRLYGGDIPFLQTGDVAHSGGRIRTFSQTLNARGLLVSRLFPKGTLFFTIAANIGDVGIASFAAACPDSLVAITPKDGVSTEWLLHELASRKSDFESLASPGAQLNINLEKLRPYVLAVPPAAEQRAIAAALTDADALIDSLEQLLAKKRQIKQGAMQELLTGKRRLPGFSGAWDDSFLGSLLHSHPDYGINAPAVQSALSLPTYLRITDIDDDGRFLAANSMSVDHPGADDYYLHPGDIVFARTGASVGKSYIYRISDGPLVFAGFLIRVQPDSTKLVPEYLFYFCKTRRYWNWVTLMSMRSGQPGINSRELNSMPVLLPQVDEQRAIAQVLSDMDADIAETEARLTKARDLKQAMAQALLTGRVRLV